jgi:hypothetical protein
MIPLWVKNRGEQITDSATFRWLAQDAGSGAVDLTLLKGSGSATFTRAGATATTVLSTGLVSSAIAANTARSYYDPTTLQYLGYLAEEARTNLVLRSEDFSLAWAAVGTPTRSAAAKTCGALNMDLIGDDAAGTLEGYTQTITYTADATKTVSLFIAQGTSTSTIIRLRDTTAPADRLLAAITWSGGLPVITMTTGTSQGYTTFPGSIFRIQLLTTSVTAANTNSLQVYPATDAALSVANTGNVYIGGVQSENGAFATSYIPTAAATSTRAADVMTFPSAGNIIDASGTVFARASSVWATASATSYVLATDSSGRFIYNSAGASTGFNNFDGTTVGSATGTSYQNRVAKLATSWGGSTKTSYFDAVSGGSSAYDGTFVTGAIAIGVQNGGGGPWNGTIRDVRIWQRVLSDSEVHAL